jgi:hypothetical protein
MELKIQTPAYDITDGNKEFDSVQINGNLAAIQVLYSDINSDDVTAELYQSLDGTNFDVITGSFVTIDKNKPSHTWNITGITPGIFIRVKTSQGSATAGSIDKIKILH